MIVSSSPAVVSLAISSLSSVAPSMSPASEFARGEMAGGERIGAEDVNRAAGENDKFKREDFSRDAGPEEQGRLLRTFEQASDFCLTVAKANCFLVDKDLSRPEIEHIGELVDLKFLHHVKSRVTVRERPHRLYDAYMLDLSQGHWGARPPKLRNRRVLGKGRRRSAAQRTAHLS